MIVVIVVVVGKTVRRHCTPMVVVVVEVTVEIVAVTASHSRKRQC